MHRLTLRLKDVFNDVHYYFVGLLDVSCKLLGFVLLPKKYALERNLRELYLLFATDGFGEAVEEDGGEIVELSD
jgi:hypothetical protein